MKPSPFRHLEQQLDLDHFDVIDIVPIPLHGDRMVRLRTLEEAIEDFRENNDITQPGVMGYFVQVKPRGKTPPQAQANAAAAPAVPASEARQALAAFDTEEDGALPAAASALGDSQVYLNNGKLNLPYLNRSAELLFRSGEYSLARNIYRAMMQSGEKTGLAIYGIARCFQAEGKLEEARINYEEAIAYLPQADAYKNLASVLVQQNKDSQAAEVLERALHLKDLSKETRFEFHKTAGNCWSRANHPREAERHYNKAIEIDSRSDEIQVNMGALHLQEGKVREAENRFKHALALNPKCHQALTGLGSCALADGNKNTAHAWFTKSLEIEIRNPTAIFHLVKCAYEIKNYSAAARILEDYIQVAPVNVHLLYSLAGLQYHLSRLAEAGLTCRKILELAPGHAGASELLARVETVEGLNPGRK